MAQSRAVPRSVRFEVFKRDAFKCQYCGAAAPEVLLQLDHIQPRAGGGRNDVANFVTACASCNSGKSDRRLDDNTAVTKQRVQLEELQERRDQLEMLLEWKQGLNALKEDTITELCHYWEGLAPGFTVNDNGRRNIQKWLRRFQLDEILHAMDVAAEQYLAFADTGVVTDTSWEEAFGKIPGICRVERASKEDPDLKELYYIRGIARNNCSSFNATEALDLLKAARSWDVPLDELRQVALQARSWTRFRNDICDIIDEHKVVVERRDQADDQVGRCLTA